MDNGEKNKKKLFLKLNNYVDSLVITVINNASQQNKTSLKYNAIE